VRPPGRIGQEARSCPTRSRGLTLVEVLIALSVLAVFLLPVMIGFSQALITTSQASISAAGSSVARGMIEDLKLVGYDGIQSSTGRSYKDLKTAGDHYFQVETKVTEVEPNDQVSLKGLKLVEVTVYNTGSQTPLVALSTYFTPAGV
jgi:prepilin-type N-terminal cleavage/methylation domain-containing protein